MCFGTNYSTTEYEHDISPFYWKSTYYKQGLFVDSTPEYGVRTVGFHILLYINIIPKQHVRSPVTLNVTSGVVNALGAQNDREPRCVLGISNTVPRKSYQTLLYANGL